MKIDFDEWVDQENARAIKKYETLLNDDLPDGMREKLECWLRMLKGDYKSLIEIMIERGMATKEDFPDYEDDNED